MFHFQIDHKPSHKVHSHHQDNHVSQIGKSIVSHHYGSSSPSPSHGDQNGHARSNGVSNGHYQKNHKTSVQHATGEWQRQHDELPRNGDDGIYGEQTQSPQPNNAAAAGGTHSLLQYAMLNFRQSSDK